MSNIGIRHILNVSVWTDILSLPASVIPLKDAIIVGIITSHTIPGERCSRVIDYYDHKKLMLAAIAALLGASMEVESDRGVKCKQVAQRIPTSWAGMSYKLLVIRTECKDVTLRVKAYHLLDNVNDLGRARKGVRF